MKKLASLLTINGLVPTYVNCYWKMIKYMVTLTKHVIPGPDVHCAGAPGT